MKKPGSTSPATVPLAFTISDFCAAHTLGRTTYYDLERIGKAPRKIKLGKKVLITAEAAADWRREREAETLAAL